MVNRGKRIAMVAYTIFRSDARVRRHVTALRRQGYSVDVYALIGPDGVRDADEEGLAFHLPQRRVPKTAGKFGILLDYVKFALACSFLLLRDHLRGERFGLVHVNNMPNFLIMAAVPLRLMGVPVLLDIHDTMPEIYQDKFGVGPDHWIIRALFVEERWSMKLAHYVLTTEHTKWERLLENGLETRKSRVTLNLPDSGVFPDGGLRPAAVEEGAEFRLVYHGTLAHRLGLDLAIEAMELLRDRIPTARLNIIGDGEHREELVRLATERGLLDRITFSDGFVPMEELPGMLAGSHLAVIPSRKRIGTRLMLPTKLLEYVRIGIPAVTVATHTITRYFDESMVRFAESENSADLADRIQELHDHPEELERLAVEARKFYETYNFETERESYLAVVAALAAGEEPGPDRSESR